MNLELQIIIVHQKLQYDLLCTYCSNNKLKNIEILEEYLLKNHNISIGSANSEKMTHLFNLCCTNGKIEMTKWIINNSL